MHSTERSRKNVAQLYNSLPEGTETTPFAAPHAVHDPQDKNSKKKHIYINYPTSVTTIGNHLGKVCSYVCVSGHEKVLLNQEKQQTSSGKVKNLKLCMYNSTANYVQQSLPCRSLQISPFELSSLIWRGLMIAEYVAHESS